MVGAAISHYPDTERRDAIERRKILEKPGAGACLKMVRESREVGGPNVETTDLSAVAKVKGRIEMWQRVLALLALIMVGGLAVAQQTRIEVTSAAMPVDDVKANSAAIPDVYAIAGQFERIVVLRFKYQTDLLAGLDSAVKREKIRNAVILAGTGSVRSYHFHVVSNREFPTKNIFVKDTTAPADIVSTNGYVIDGRVHAHITLTDADKAFGGHLEPGTSVFTFAIVTLGVFKDGMDLRRIDDKTYR